MSPRLLRAQQLVSLDEMAKRLGTSQRAVRTLESTPAEGWMVGTLREYLAALGLSLEVTAVSRDGAREVLS